MTYIKEVLEKAVSNSTSMAGVMRYFGISVNGGNHRLLLQKIRAWEIDISHFTGQGWSRGLSSKTDERVRNSSKTKRIPDEEVFRLGSVYPSSRLRKRLLEIGWEERCSVCGLNEWLGKKLCCHVDHINGDTSDARFDNLRFICPNCHQQTETWGFGSSKTRATDRFCDRCGEEKIYSRSKSGLCFKCRTSGISVESESEFTRPCSGCSSPISLSGKTGLCKECVAQKRRIAERPTAEELSILMSELSMVKIGIRYGVSDNAVRKWARSYKLL